MDEEVSKPDVSQNQAFASQYNQSHTFGGTEQILTRFPRKHSCGHCKEDVINALNAKSFYPATFLRDRGGAIEAAKNGCELYEWLLIFLFRSEAPPNHGFYIESRSLKDPHDISSVRFLIGTQMYTWPCAEFEVFTEEENPAASCISTRPFNADVSSSASLGVMKSWLTYCCESHKECESPIPQFLPTRLIDVSTADTSWVVKIASDHRNISPSEAFYATLSYCWGGDQFTKTTRATVFQHHIGIKTENLGQTLQDAIKVTHSLGLRFLWVDSLCIIQDDPQDMAQEISRMSAYYENGSVSICASVAAGCNGGFLAPRTNNPYLYGPFELPYRGANNREGSIKLVKYHKYSREMEPVTSRAWIMQESLLAPRILSYSYQSVAWSCRKANHSDGGPIREWYDFEDRKTWAKLQNEKDLEVCIRKWNGLVESYTSRTLSDSKDMLPAISGIAQKYVKLLQRCTSHDRGFLLAGQIRLEPEDVECLKYVAGLWYCRVRLEAPPAMFLQQLLWSTSYYEAQHKHYPSTDHESGTIARRLLAPTLEANCGSTALTSPIGMSQFLGSQSNGTYLAPSWSWAAVEVPISYECVDRHFSQASEFSIIDCTTSLELSEAPYGNVTSGRLMVKGLLIPALHDTLSSQFQVAWRFVFRPDTNKSDEVLCRIMEGKEEGWVLQLTNEEIMTTAKARDPNWTPNAPKGLLVVAEGQCYRRIGLCSFERRLGIIYRQNYRDGMFTPYGEMKTITII